MIDGYRSVGLRASQIEKLRKLMALKGYSSLPKVMDYLIGYWEESNQTKI